MKLSLGVEDDRVVQRPSVQRVGVRHDGRRARVRRSAKSGFHAPFRSGNPELANFGHVTSDQDKANLKWWLVMSIP